MIPKAEEASPPMVPSVESPAAAAAPSTIHIILQSRSKEGIRVLAVGS